MRIRFLDDPPPGIRSFAYALGRRFPECVRVTAYYPIEELAWVIRVTGYADIHLEDGDVWARSDLVDGYATILRAGLNRAGSETTSPDASAG